MILRSRGALCYQAVSICFTHHSKCKGNCRICLVKNESKFIECQKQNKNKKNEQENKTNNSKNEQTKQKQKTKEKKHNNNNKTNQTKTLLNRAV